MGSTSAVGHRGGELSPGSVVGKYSIVREVGRGGMCFVYEARHQDLEKYVAIKTLKPDIASDPMTRQRFLREGRAASRIHHPHVVDVVDVGEHAGMVYMVMEYLHGEDLAARIKSTGSLPVAAAIELLLPVVSAISVAHDHGVVHRDLKPANIFLASGRHGNVVPKVVDFGISKLSDEDPNAAGLTGTDAVLGTPCYMAPEQIRGARHAVPATDQYALGVILYQSVTGHRPFEGTNVYNTLEQIMMGRCLKPREWEKDIPEALEAVIMRAMAHDALQRFGSVAELGAALLPFASSHVQSQWWQEFGRVRVSAPPTVSAPPRPGVRESVDQRGGIDQTQPLGPEYAAPPTLQTMRQTAAELPARSTVGSPRRRIAALATLLVAVLVGGSVGTLLGARTGGNNRAPQRVSMVRPSGSAAAMNVANLAPSQSVPTTVRVVPPLASQPLATPIPSIPTTAVPHVNTAVAVEDPAVVASSGDAGLVRSATQRAEREHGPHVPTARPRFPRVTDPSFQQNPY